MHHRILVWFSCGAASAVAAKLAVEKYGPRCEVLYCDTLATEHPDNARFFRDVEVWLGTPIRVVRSDAFESIDAVFERTRYMAGIAGARCTVELKKRPRVAYQLDTDTHVFGYTADEQKRAAQFERNNPALAVEWILIEESVTKAECLQRLSAAGIALPAMYALGFDHNNCLGCVKATSPGYWNRTRRLFPEVFARRARQSRILGVRLARLKGARVFLDVLPSDADAPDDDIECGPACQTPGTAQ
jgi:3'-phosphoadenosine 5'-phosphosulfate sulfotransferase (PAPS reductase)/FAD synthetase